ncbi:MAG: integrase, partial [Nakamurella sp.]
TTFLTGNGLALPDDSLQRRAREISLRYLEAITQSLRVAVVEYDQTQHDQQERTRWTGGNQLSDSTLQTRLRIIRDLAEHLIRTRPVTGWAEVTTGDLESFLAQDEASRHQKTYVLRRFFGWAKQRRLVLADPTRPLRLGAQPGFVGSLLDVASQGRLFNRWTSPDTHPHERLTGLFALLHAASNAEIRALTLADIDTTRRAVQLHRRPFKTELDPITWTCLQDSLRYRDGLHTLNPHVIVTAVTRTRDSAADSSYLSRLLKQANTTPAICRQTRIAQLVIDLDPKLVAVALGMNPGGLVRYCTDNVDHDRLSTTRR